MRTALRNKTERKNMDSKINVAVVGLGNRGFGLLKNVLISNLKKKPLLPTRLLNI